MARVVLLLCVLVSVAHADSTRALPVDAVTHGRPGDWAVYEGQVRVGTRLEHDRKAISLRVADRQVEVAWYRGAKDNEAFAWSDTFPSDRPIDTRLLGYGASKVQSWTTESATCKLDTSFACTRLTFEVSEPGGPTKIVMTMADRVRALGIVELEITDKTGLVWKSRVVGYGRRGETEWGVGTKRLFQLDSDSIYGGLVGYEDAEIGGFGLIGHGPSGQIGGMSGRYIGGRPTAAQVVFGTLNAQGSLDRAIIRRYLRRNINRLRYCYEKRLLVKPAIWGRMMVGFTIDDNGKVTSATATGVDPVVSTCVARIHRMILFPKPKASFVRATYSLTFRPPLARKTVPYKPYRSRKRP